MNAKKKSAADSSLCNICVKGANIGDLYSVHLNGKTKAIFAGSVSEEIFTISVPTKKANSIVLKIISQTGEVTQKHIIPDKDKNTTDVLLKPAAQIRESGGQKHFASIREMLNERRRQLSLQKNP